MNLRSIVRAYITNVRPRVNEELGWWRQQPTLRDAIRFAAFATNSKGKRYSHQRRLSRMTLGQTYDSLLVNEKKIEQCRDFDELYTILHELLAPIRGVGELYVYDTSVRIGARLGRLPKKVYLHAGTRVGAQALGFDPKARALELSQLPRELWALEPYEVEDLLCIFKDQLSNVQASMATQDANKRCVCD
jgi:hypothetical protein